VSRAVCALLLAAALTACATGPVPSASRGQAGSCTSDRGIGGTGLRPRVAGQSDRGIGGTGIQVADVIGIVTGFGSICVDGLEVALDQRTRVVRNGQPMKAHDLRVGDVVAVATRAELDALSAERIEILHVVRGPVEAIGPGRRAIIAGQTVDIPDGLANVREGGWVAVSGLRRSGGVIVASRIDAIQRGIASITGLVSSSAGSLAIGRAVLHGSGPVDGRVMTVEGPYANGVLTVTSVRPATLHAIAPAARSLVVQAYVSTAGDRLMLGQGLTIGRGPGIVMAAADVLAIVQIEPDVRGDLVAVGLDTVLQGGADGMSIPTSVPASGAASGATTGQAHGPAPTASGSDDTRAGSRGQGKAGASSVGTDRAGPASIDTSNGGTGSGGPVGSGSGSGGISSNGPSGGGSGNNDGSGRKSD
jgi:hypothetical protein